MGKSDNKTPFVVKVKDNFKDEVVGFNNSVKKLSDRNDLDDLMEIALNSQSPGLTKFFDHMPSADEWNEYKSAKYLKTENPE